MKADEQEAVWKALADPTRRRILDLLRDGPRTTGVIAQEFPDVTRFAVMKHLAKLEEATLLITEVKGREKFHYLNAVPLRQIVERWIAGYADEAAGSMLRLKRLFDG